MTWNSFFCHGISIADDHYLTSCFPPYPHCKISSFSCHNIVTAEVQVVRKESITISVWIEGEIFMKVLPRWSPRLRPDPSHVTAFIEGGWESFVKRSL